MPATIRKVGDKFQVFTPNAVHAKGTTKKKAESQKRLLNAIDHGWKPTGMKGHLMGLRSKGFFRGKK